jgi:hypothetical protein
VAYLTPHAARKEAFALLQSEKREWERGVGLAQALAGHACHYEKAYIRSIFASVRTPRRVRREQAEEVREVGDVAEVEEVDEAQELSELVGPAEEVDRSAEEGRTLWQAEAGADDAASARDDAQAEDDVGEDDDTGAEVDAATGTDGLRLVPAVATSVALPADATGTSEGDVGEDSTGGDGTEEGTRPVSSDEGGCKAIHDRVPVEAGGHPMLSERAA